MNRQALEEIRDYFLNAATSCRFYAAEMPEGCKDLRKHYNKKADQHQARVDALNEVLNGTS